MRKMKKGPALVAGILGIPATFIALLGFFLLTLSAFQYNTMSAGDMVRFFLSNIIGLVLMVLLTVCCFRRKLDTFPGIVMGLYALYALYSVINNIINLVSGTSDSTDTLLYLCSNLLQVVLFTLLLLCCFSKKEKLSRFLPIGFVVMAAVSLIATFFGVLPSGVRLSDLDLFALLVPAFTAIFTVLFDKLPHIFLALAVNGAKEETDPYAQQMAQFQAAQYQPQYQAPQYQAPQYQAPQYQAPQYQAPQYQAPQYQAPQYQAPQYQAPQQPQYQVPQYQAPQAPSQKQ